MNTRQIRRRCRDLVRTLDVPSPFDLDRFFANLASGRGRPVDLLPIAMPPGSPCGMWLATGDRDFIVYEARTTRLHQEHIIMHEVGHLLGDHGHGAAVDPTAARTFLPHLDPEFVSRMLTRTEYSATEERIAETVASMILERANRWKPVSEWTAPAHGAEIRSRLGKTFEPPVDRRRP